MKKLVSAALALALTLSMSTVAFAEEQDLTNYLNKAPVVSKTYQINNGTAPAEEFTFHFDGVSYKNGDGQVVSGANIPAIQDVKISFDKLSANDTKTVEAAVNVNDFELGVYTYHVTEVKPDTKTTGVTYSDENLYLVLSILRDEQSNKKYVAAMHYETVDGADKSTGFTNEYDSGKLTVTKHIAGNMADLNKKFKFTITFTAPEGTEIKSDIQAPANVTKDGLTYTVELGHNESVVFDNIPAGTTYTVEEDNENYTLTNESYSDNTKTISANDEDTANFTNTLTNEIDTGINLDSMPYVLMLVVAGAGLAVFFFKKRMMHEN